MAGGRISRYNRSRHRELLLHAAFTNVKQIAAEARDVIEDTLKLPMSEGKLLLQKVLNGGSPPQQLANNTFVQELQQASLFCRWAAATMLKDTAWPSLVEMKERPDVSVLTYFWNIAEDLVLDAWLRKVKSLQSKHTSLHFDGIRVDKDIAQPDVEAFCTSCSDAILEETGLVVHIRAKERYTFHALLTQVSDSKAAECPENLREPGNCILAALHHLGLQEQATSMAGMTEGPEHTFFLRRRQRRYSQVAEKLKL